jgi:Ala-tRNA(Pro) deacylase
MSTILQNYLIQQGVIYKTVPHRQTDTSVNSASSAKVSAENVAKPVILKDDKGYLMVVVPADHHVKLWKLNKLLHRKLKLATESEISALFADCAPGAVPPIGQAFGIETIVDASLDSCPDVYLEAGDHVGLVHLKGSSYRRLMRHTTHARIC